MVAYLYGMQRIHLEMSKDDYYQAQRQSHGHENLASERLDPWNTTPRHVLEQGPVRLGGHQALTANSTRG